MNNKPSSHFLATSNIEQAVVVADQDAYIAILDDTLDKERAEVVYTKAKYIPVLKEFVALRDAGDRSGRFLELKNILDAASADISNPEIENAVHGIVTIENASAAIRAFNRHHHLRIEVSWTT